MRSECNAEQLRFHAPGKRKWWVVLTASRIIRVRRPAAAKLDRRLTLPAVA